MSRDDAVGGDQATQRAAERSLMQRAAGSAAKLFARFGIITLISGVTTIALTRALGPPSYGAYASAIATWSLLGAIADFGLTPMLTRDTASHAGPPSRATFRNAYQVAAVWCSLLTVVEIGLAFSAGITSTRGTLLVILAPGMLFNSLNPARTVFVVMYRAGILLTIDAISAVIQAAIVLAFLAGGLGPEAVAIIIVVTSVVNNLIVLWNAEALLRNEGGRGLTVQAVIRRAAPLAMLSILAQVYFTIDLVLLGWLVHGPRLGDYAAASKLLQLITGISGVVVTGSLPALATTARQGGDLDPLMARMWHWLLVVIMPIFITVAVSGPLIIRVAFGHAYASATPLLRILCLAGIVSPVVNIASSVMLSLEHTRGLFVQNIAAVVLNVAGNLILVPIVGVAAAAWLTFATDVLVAGLALASLRGAIHPQAIRAVSGRPLAALACTLAVELVLSESAALAGAAGIVTFIAAATLFRAWPEEFGIIPRRVRALVRG